MKHKKVAGFWIRLSGRLIDSLITFSLIIGITFSGLKYEPKIEYLSPLAFYITSIASIIILFSYFIIVPTFWKKTLGMSLLRIEIQFDNNQNRFFSIIKREVFFSLTWVLSIVLVISFINHSLITKYQLSRQSEVTYSSFESLRLSIVTTVSSIMIMCQTICAMSIIVRKGKIGLHDSMSQTKTVWKNKYISVKKDSDVKIIEPKLVNQIPVLWEE